MMLVANAYNQIITYWSPATPNGYGGYNYGAPVPLLGRWEDKAEEITSPIGEKFISRSTVFVPADVVIGGYLMLGSSAAADPSVLPSAFPIRQFIKVPDIRSADHERRAIL